jgi:predicted ester cyclase
MSAEENKTAFRRVPEEVINTGNLDVAGEVIASDYVEHVPYPPGMLSGFEGWKLFFTMFHTAFPDMHYTVENILAEGDMVAMHVTARGTHQGEFMGIAPTGTEVTWTETHIGRFENGKLVEHWGNSDDLGMMEQLGAIPEPGQSEEASLT